MRYSWGMRRFVLVLILLAAAACSNNDSSTQTAPTVPPSTTDMSDADGGSSSIPTTAAAPTPASTATTSTTATDESPPVAGGRPDTFVVGTNSGASSHLIDGVRLLVATQELVGTVEGYLPPQRQVAGASLDELLLADLPEYSEEMARDPEGLADWDWETAQSRLEFVTTQRLVDAAGETVVFNKGSYAELWFAHGRAWWEDVLPSGIVVGRWADEGYAGVYLVDGDEAVDIGPDDIDDRNWVQAAVQSSGNLVVVEADPRNGTNPTFLVIDPETEEVVATFEPPEGVEAVWDMDYDETGTWLIVLYDGNLVEILGQGTRMLIELREGAWRKVSW